MSKILVVSNDIVGRHMAGPGIRSWEFASLLSAEHEVTLAAPSVGDVTSTNFALATYRNDRDLQRLGDSADIILTQGVTVAIHPSLARQDCIIIVDFYDPFLVETLHQTNKAHSESAGWQGHLFQLTLSAMNTLGRIGDFFLCASEEQRSYWLGQLSALGRLNPVTYDGDGTFYCLIDIVPFGLPSHPPVHTKQVLKGVIPGIGTDDKVILWGGGIYEWFDPCTLVRAMGDVAADEPKAKLFFMGARHPNPAVGFTQTAKQAMELARELGLLDRHIFFHPKWVAYEERQNYLLEADIGVSTHFDCIETRFSYRTRVLDYIWAGLPTVTTRGDSLAELVHEHKLGRVVDFEDVSQLTKALLELLRAPNDARASLRENSEEIARLMRWEEIGKPLLQFCANPQKASDAEFLSDPAIVKATHGDYQHPQSYLGKAWIIFKLRGPLALVREARSYLWWRLIGPD